MEAQRPLRLPLELILTVADLLQPSDLLNLIQGIPQIAPLLKHQHIQAQDDNKHTLLYLIVEQGLDELIAPLARWIPPKIIIPEDEGWTPLHQAVGNANQRMVKALVDAGSYLSAQDQRGKTALHLACRKDAVEIVRFLLDHGANPSAVDHHQETPLHNACGKDIAIMQMLLKTGVDPNSRRMPLGSNPLRNEIMYGQESGVRILLEAGADPCLPDANGSTLLHKAAVHDLANSMRLFLEFGADINLRNSSGSTPFMKAALCGSSECLEVLLAAGANILDVDDNGCTALHMAAWSGRESTVRRLLELGLDISAQDGSGRTPMRCAVEYGQTGVVQILEDAQTSRSKKAIDRMSC